MKINNPLYGALSVVFVASFGLALCLPTTEILKGISGLPAVGALFMALWTIYRDDEAHRKSLELENHRQFLNLSVTSHMAEVAFDKHVIFCEEYINRLKQGPTSIDSVVKFEEFSQELRAIRDKHAPWVSYEMTDRLSACEMVWHQIGVGVRIIQETRGTLRDEYNEKVRKLYEELHAIGDFSGNPTNRQKVINIIQDILGVNDLTKLRENLVREAAKSLTCSSYEQAHTSAGCKAINPKAPT